MFKESAYNTTIGKKLKIEPSLYSRKPVELFFTVRTASFLRREHIYDEAAMLNTPESDLISIMLDLQIYNEVSSYFKTHWGYKLPPYRSISKRTERLFERVFNSEAQEELSSDSGELSLLASKKTIGNEIGITTSDYSCASVSLMFTVKVAGILKVLHIYSSADILNKTRAELIDILKETEAYGPVAAYLEDRWGYRLLDSSATIINEMPQPADKTPSSAILNRSDTKVENCANIEAGDNYTASALDTPQEKGGPELFEGNTPCYKQYQLVPDDYENIVIETAFSSVRIKNALKRHGIATVAELLHLSWDEIRRIKNLGRNSFKEISDYFESLATLESGSQNRKQEKYTVDKGDLQPFDWRNCDNLVRNREKILSGDFDFIRNSECLSPEEEKYLQRCEAAYCDLGSDIIESFCCDHDYAEGLLLTVDEIAKGFANLSRIEDELKQILADIPREKLQKRAKPYIIAFTSNESLRTVLAIGCAGDLSLYDYANLVYSHNYESRRDIDRFLRWCRFNLHEEISTFLPQIFNNARISTIIKMRANKCTLEQVGKAVGLTRERARQLEVKAMDKAARWNSHSHLLEKISAEENGCPIIDKELFFKYFGEYADSAFFLLKHAKSWGKAYDDLIDAFVVGNQVSSEIVLNEIERLPEAFSTKLLPEMIHRVFISSGASKEYVSKAVINYYTLTGELYHRTRFSLKHIYTDILGRYYPNGIHTNDDAEIAVFRNRIYQDYGEIALPNTNHAIAAQITRCGVALNRGTYGIRKESTLPAYLISAVYRYITESSSSVILVSAVFSEFEQEFLANGVDNPYYMAGVLREQFEGEFLFRKGYIYKGRTATDIYKEIQDYILQSHTPVSKAEIQREFPGVTDIVIQTAIMDERILNYFGEYLYVGRLDILDSEIRCFHSALSTMLDDGRAHHIKEVFDALQTRFDGALNRNGISTAFRLFSVLEYFLADEFQFSRPYIAKWGVTIGRAGERLKELVLNSDEIEISEITSFAKENQFQITSILDYVNSFNETHLLKSKESIAAITDLGVNAECAREVERMILEEIGENTALIVNLECIHKFPQVFAAWNEWLVYSTLLKWSDQLDVGVTDSQFRRATPIVAKKGHLVADEYRDAQGLNKITLAKPDDLNNIDDLISEYVLDGDV